MKSKEVSPLNVLHLSGDGLFVECWQNGTRAFTIHIGGQLANAVDRGQEWFELWTDLRGSIGKELQAAINLDAPVVRQLEGCCQ